MQTTPNMNFYLGQCQMFKRRHLSHCLNFDGKFSNILDNQVIDQASDNFFQVERVYSERKLTG